MKYLKIGTRQQVFEYFRDNMLTGVGYAADEGKPVYYNSPAGCVEFKPHVAGQTCTLQINLGQLQKNVGNGWETYTANSVITFTQPIYLRGIGTDSIINKSFVMTGEVECHGNILALLDYNTEFHTVRQYCFATLFKNCASLITAPDCSMIKTFGGYPSIFQQCFYGCTSLKTAPKLPNIECTENCYLQCFHGCTSLKAAPELPATTLAEKCYELMFYGCTSLKAAPELPATTLAEKCYGEMFSGCTSLRIIKMLATDVSASACLSNWLNGVNDKGLIAAPAGTSLPMGNSGVPTGWTRCNI